MRFWSQRYWVILLCGGLALTLGCQSAQKQTFMPPSAAQAPALVASATPDPAKQKAAVAAPNTESQTKAQAAQALAVGPVGDLIASVEKEYQAGQENYRTGHMEAAKQNFDSAFNLLLGGGFDLQSDD